MARPLTANYVPHGAYMSALRNGEVIPTDLAGDASTA
jgi:hypothetical protein